MIEEIKPRCGWMAHYRRKELKERIKNAALVITMVAFYFAVAGTCGYLEL